MPSNPQCTSAALAAVRLRSIDAIATRNLADNPQQPLPKLIMNTAPQESAASLVTPPPLTAGRYRKPVWELVQLVGNDVYCTMCKKHLQSTCRTHVGRIENHMSKCPKRSKDGKITDIFQPKMSLAVLKKFHDRFALWVYSTGMALYKAEHSSLLEALQVLNAGATVPSPYQLATSLLDKAYEHSIEKLNARLEGRLATLVTDAWTDINGLSVVNYIAVSGADAFFLESAYIGSQSHDAEFLCGDVVRVLIKYKEIAFCSVVTDNTCTNKLMWKELQVKYPKLFFHGCICHALHLLVKDLIERLQWLKKLQEGCKTLVAYFKKNHMLWFQLKSKLKENGLQSLVLPGDTRWGSLLACLESVLSADTILFMMVSARNFQVAKTKKQRNMRKTIHDFVTSADFEPQLQRGVNLLKVVPKRLVALEKDSRPISDVYRVFLELPSDFKACKLPARDLKTVEKIVKDRFDFVYGDAHGLAYLLDPRYCEDGMDIKTCTSIPLEVVWR